MYLKTKYIVTANNEIIVFPEIIQHSQFRHFHPKSAGFISFYNNKGNIECTCYGESVSLDLKSREKEDTDIANRQLLKTL